jgi:xanthine dehydrogenase accessory factor
VSPDQVMVEAARLEAAGEPYALATVVRVRRPASTRCGDRAIVHADGTLMGWIGGACSEPVVVREALRALAAGEPHLIRIGPAGTPGDGADVVAENSCASQGTVEVLIEPGNATPRLAVIGHSPAAHALTDMAERVGWRVTRGLDPGASAVVVAAMGRGDEEALQSALASGAGYVGLVASARRATSVLAELRARGVGEDALSRVRSPAGLDLGPLRQEEIAVAVLAELVAWRHTRTDAVAEATVQEAVDPVCGMTVVVGPSTESLTLNGVAYHFCCPACRSRFEADPGRYLSDVAAT